MERVYQNDPDDVSATNSWVYQYEDPQYNILRNEPSNNIESVHFGSNHNRHPIQYGPMPIFKHPGGYIPNTYPPIHDPMNAANFAPYGSQFHYLQSPIFHRYPRKFQNGLLVAKNFYNRRGPATKYFRNQHIHRPESFDGNSLWFSSGDNIYAENQSNFHTRVYSHNDGHPFTESRFFPSSEAKEKFSALKQDTVNGYSLPVDASGWDSTLIDDSGTQNTYHGADLTQSNSFGMSHGFLQQNFPQPENCSLSKGANGDAGFINEGTHRGPCTNPTKPSEVSLRTLGSPVRATQTGQRGNIQRNKSISSFKIPAPRVRIGNRKASAPHRVWKKKSKAQPAASPSKQTRKPTSPIHHIKWDGVNEESELAGQNCPACNENLAYPPIDDEYEYFNELLDEPPKLPDVAVLACGHVFHSQCLELITPVEQSSDPPCFLCTDRGENRIPSSSALISP